MFSDRLKPKCRYVVGNFTEAEAADINLNPIVKNFCKDVIRTHCMVYVFFFQTYCIVFVVVFLCTKKVN